MSFLYPPCTQTLERLSAPCPFYAKGSQCAKGSDGYLCTRQIGHDGPHIAHAGPMLRCIVWENKDCRPTAPFVAASETSRLAAISIEPDTGRIRRFCFDWIKTAGEYGLTCDELETFTEMRHQTASARIVELRNRGEIAPLIGPDGHPIRRRTRSGRLAQAWIAYQVS